MIGRAALGAPWIFRALRAGLGAPQAPAAPPTATEVRDIILAHLDDLYAFYGEYTGLRVARKHLGWYRDGVAALSLGTAPAAPTTTDAGTADTFYALARASECAETQRSLVLAWLSVACTGLRDDEEVARSAGAQRRVG